MRICLTGFMGSGKTAYGLDLAKILNFDFYDTDKIIEDIEKKNINDIFSEKGESYFRKIESVVLIDLLEKDNVVISTGGGLPAFSDNMGQMAEKSVVVFLKPEIKELFNRLKDKSENRPVLSNVPPEKLMDKITELYNQRLQYYKKAQLIISPVLLTPEFLAKYIMKLSN